MGNLNVKWIEQNNEQLSIIGKVLKVITNSSCKSILDILKNSSKLTFEEIYIIGKEKQISKTKVFRCLKELEKLGFIFGEAKIIPVKLPPNKMGKQNTLYLESTYGELVFSLDKEEIGKFIACINSTDIGIETIGLTPLRDVFEIDYMASGTVQKHVLNYTQLKKIRESVECFVFTPTFDILKKLSVKDLTDKRLIYYNDQATTYRNLKRLEASKFIVRKPEKNYVVNSLRNDSLKKNVAFLKSVSYITVDHSLNKKRHPYNYKMGNRISFVINPT